MSQTMTCHRCDDPSHLVRSCPQSHRPSQLVGSTPYQASSHQSMYQGAGKGSQHILGIE